SLDAIQNLAELTQDPDVATAARAVLDFSAAKYAVSSSLLRRESPYRRRVSANTDDFFFHGAPGQDTEATIDDQACRFALYAGTTDLYPTVAGPNASTVSLVPDSCLYVTRQAAGTYRVPPMILELAMNKAQEPYLQTFSGGFND